MSAATSHPLEQRVVELETLVMHLQHDLESLNAVALEQQRELDHFRRMLTRIDDRMSRLDSGEERIDPASEKPPHY